jgi:hypothetical protein
VNRLAIEAVGLLREVKKKGNSVQTFPFFYSPEKVTADLKRLVAPVAGMLFRDRISMVLHFRANGRSQHRPVFAVGHVSGYCPCHGTFHHAVMLGLLSGGNAERGKEEPGRKKSGLYVGSCD